MPGEPPLIVLGVRRSGTTLLRVMLDRNRALAVPDESYFVPQLARRHRGRVDSAAFVDDLRRLPTLVEWGLSPDAVARRLHPGMTTGDAIAAVFEAYAGERGKARWGDKTPLYMQYLPLLERLFPRAVYVHLIRDGRDAATSFLEVPDGIMTAGWGHPRDAAGFATQWATEVRAARGLGARVGAARYLEVRYEALVAAPGEELRRDLQLRRPGVRRRDARLRRPHRFGAQGSPEAARRTSARRRAGLEDGDGVGGHQGVRGDRRRSPARARVRGVEAGTDRRRLAAYGAKTRAWRAVGAVTQRSPLWRRRHAILERPASDTFGQ